MKRSWFLRAGTAAIAFSGSLATLYAQLGPVVVSILAVLGSRAIVVLGPPLLYSRAKLAMTGAERGVLVWGGLRGALTITLALALPTSLPQRPLLIAMAFGVVLFSLVVQGITLPFVVRRAGLAHVD